MTNVKILIKVKGDKEIERAYSEMEKKFEQPREPMVRTADLMLREILRNFASQGRLFGEPWPPLSPITLGIKRRLGYGDRPPLVRTGLMKRSFRRNLSDKYRTLILDNPISYFPFHQLGAPTKRIPRRTMLKLDRRRQAMILKLFIRWVEVTLKNIFKKK